VQKNAKEEKSACLFDIYDNEGHFIYQTQFSISTNLIRNGSLYYIDSNDDEDELTVKRFKISNWQSLKAAKKK